MDARYGASEWEYRRAVSNYNREIFPCEDTYIEVGSEDVNGEGNVRFLFTQADEHETVLFYMPWEKAGELAAFVARKAAEAHDVQEEERQRGL